jgi:hypothetical protein
MTSTNEFSEIVTEVCGLLKASASSTKASIEEAIVALSALLDSLHTEVQGKTSSRSELLLASVNGLLGSLKETYGDMCVASQSYREAISSYLTMSVPSASKAIRAAKADGDWQMALLLSKQFAAQLPAEVSTKRLANDIVQEFR